MLGTPSENLLESMLQPSIYISQSMLDSLDFSSANYEMFVGFDSREDLDTLKADLEMQYDFSVETLEEKKEQWKEPVSAMESFLGLQASLQ